MSTGYSISRLTCLMFSCHSFHMPRFPSSTPPQTTHHHHHLRRVLFSENNIYLFYLRHFAILKAEELAPTLLLLPTLSYHLTYLKLVARTVHLNT